MPTATPKPTAKPVKFYSPDGTPIRVCLPDGRTALVGATPRSLPPSFNRAAVKAGCLTSDMPSAERMNGPVVPPDADAFQRREAIKAKIEEAFNADEGAPGYEEAFTNAGLPNLNWLNKALGFNVERSERDELWNEIQHEAEVEDAANGGDEPAVE